MIKFRYIGFGRRELGDYVWEEENGFVQAVDINTAATLITYPKKQFELEPGQDVSNKDMRELANALGVPVADVKEMLEKAEITAVFKPQMNDLGGMTEERIAEFATHGILDLKALSTVNGDGKALLAANTGASRSEINAWVEQAKVLVGGNS